MQRLFKQRLGTHLSFMMKYLRLVFNDYFVLALLFLIGGVGYSYSNALKQVTGPNIWLSLLVGILYLLGLQVGRMATLIKEPDYVFLAPKEFAMVRYLKAAFKYSLVNATVIQAVIWLLLLPLVARITGASRLELGLILGTLVMLKGLWLANDLAAKLKIKQAWMQNQISFRWLLPLAIIVLILIGNYVVAFTYTFVVALIFGVIQLQWQELPVNWAKIIAAENKRMHLIYQFFNLFTDVPFIKGGVKRRRYLDGLLRTKSLASNNTYRYLYAHGMVRDTEISGMYFRLTLIGALMLFFVKGLYLPVIIGMLIIYLIGFQLIPFYNHFYDNVFIHIYPVDQQFQMTAFKQVVAKLLLVVTGLFTIVVAISNYHNPITILAMAIGGGLELIMLTYWYIPSRVAKSSGRR